MKLEIPYKRNFEWADFPIIDYDEIYTTNTNGRYFNQENAQRMIEELRRMMVEIASVPREFLSKNNTNENK
jgi:hypothetical protein